LKAFRVNIIGLSLKAHQFDFQLGDAFLKYGGPGCRGRVGASVVPTKETFIEADFRIKGRVSWSVTVPGTL
jgi:hypothetical protein